MARTTEAGEHAEEQGEHRVHASLPSGRRLDGGWLRRNLRPDLYFVVPRVLRPRFEHGFTSDARPAATPILFPDASELTWAQIADLRADKRIHQWRAAFGTVVAEALNSRSVAGFNADLVGSHARAVTEAGENLKSLPPKVALGIGSFVLGAVADVALLGVGVPVPFVGSAVGGRSGC